MAGGGGCADLKAWKRKQPKKKPALLQRNRHKAARRGKLTPELSRRNQCREARTKANRNVALPHGLLLLPACASQLLLLLPAPAPCPCSLLLLPLSRFAPLLVFIVFVQRVVLRFVVGLVAGVVGCRGSRTRSRYRFPFPTPAASARLGTFLGSVYQVQSIDSPPAPSHPSQLPAPACS